MGDGYWDSDSGTVLLCTECFTQAVVLRLIELLQTNLGLKASVKRRIANNGNVNFRIRFSGTQDNLALLRSLVKPYMHNIMHYKLGITNLEKK